MKICEHRKFDVWKWDKKSEAYKVYSYDDGSVQAINVGAIEDSGLFTIVCQYGCGESKIENPRKGITSDFFRQNWEKLQRALQQKAR